MFNTKEMIAYGTQTNPAYSCTDIIKRNSTATSGSYYLKRNNNIFVTICDQGWTLIESFQLQSDASHNKSFIEDDTISQDTITLTNYRMSQSRMTDLVSQASYVTFRATCNYGSVSDVYSKDYLEVALSNFNVLTQS
jgi:hypothetical protein